MRNVICTQVSDYILYWYAKRLTGEYIGYNNTVLMGHALHNAWVIYDYTSIYDHLK